MQNIESCTTYQINNKAFKYELFSEQVIKQQQLCYAIALNDNNTILTTSAYKNIKIHQFKNGKVKQLKVIVKHTDWITTLNFFNKRPNFVSGSQDASIIIWFSILMPHPKYMMKLKAHSRLISCIVLDHIQENLIISGSGDNNIKFWSSQAPATSEWICSQTIQNHNNSIYECSLNEDANQLISCGQDCKILILEKQKNQQWEVKQIIQQNGRGYRLKFINAHTFVFLPYSSDYIRIYQINKDQPNHLEYVNSQNISIKGGEQSCMCYFPSKFNKQKNVLVIKNGYSINCLKLNYSFQGSQHLDCKNSYHIDFSHKGEGNIFGTLSNDGQYLIVWDAFSQKFQIRIYNQDL